MFLLLFGWLISSSSWFWTFTVIGIIIPPTILSFLWNLYKKPKDVPWINHGNTSIEHFVSQLIQNIWTVMSLPYEAFLNLDAIIRTTWRMFISKRNLLQWDPSHLVKSRKNFPGHYSTMWISPVLGLG